MTPGLYPTSGMLTSAGQDELLTRGVGDVDMTPMPTNSPAILTLNPHELAEQVLAFAKRDDGGGEGAEGDRETQASPKAARGEAVGVAC